MLRFACILFLSLPLLLNGCASSETPRRPEQLTYPPLEFHIPEVETRILPNGIRLYLQEDHELPLVAVTAMLAVGSVGDPVERTGEGDLFASLLRTGGTETLSPEELDAELEFRAIDLGASADSYTTSLEMSLRSADLERGLELLAEIIRRPAFAGERLELARRQAVEAVRRQNDDPGAIAQRTLREVLYPGHPVGRTPTVASLSAIGRDDLLARHRRFVQPENLWLAVTGDFDRDRLDTLLKKLFGDWPSASAALQEVPPLPEPLAPSVWLAEKPIPQTTILMGEIGIAKDNPDLFAVRVMNYILGGGGFNSRLMREIRSNRGLAYSVYSYFQIGRRLPGLFIAGCETKSGTTAEVVDLMRSIMEQMREEPVSGAELTLAKESLINSFVFAFDDAHDVVTQKMTLDFYDYPPDYLQTYRERVAVVTVEDVQRVARTYLDPRQQSVVLVGQPGAFDRPPQELGLTVKPIIAEAP